MPTARDVLALLVCWVLLSACLNVRYPAWEAAYWYLTPALDVTLLFAAFALLGHLGVGIPRLVLWGLACLFAFVRLFRVADGVTLRMQHRETNIFIDGQLLPGLLNLAQKVLPTAKFVGITIGGVTVLALIAWAAYCALHASSRVLARVRPALGFGILVALLYRFGPIQPKPGNRQFYQGAFAASIVPRFADDFVDYWSARDFPDQVKEKVAGRAKLSEHGTVLAGLRGANVLLIFVESYGATLLHLEHYQQSIDKAYKQWEVTLQPAGFHLASLVMRSPTVGGYSWLAHVTLATGIEVVDQVRYKKLQEMRPKTIVHYFVEAGYDTLVVQPATMQDPGPLIYPFDRHRYSWEFGYRGPNFSWAPMPDQFALDFVRRHEIQGNDGPLFVEYNLVSGHMPWSNQATIISDWDSIGDGSLYAKMQGVRFDTDWADLRGAHEAYLTAMLYDLEVLRQYIEKFVRDDSLVILLGDHQPVGEVTGNSKSRGVPVHVVSRNPRFIEKFVKRGYTRGMRPQNTPPYPGTQTFLEHFLSDFSTP